jgi:hypothetical protein
MNATRPTLPQRVTAVLKAREYVVFFAIGLFALDVAVPIVSAWMHRGGPFAELMYNSWGPLADAVAARSVLIGAVWVVYILVVTWLRAGYIRSLVGPVHFRPASGRQFLNLLVFQVLLEVVGALGVWGFAAAGDDAVAANLVAFGELAVYFVVLYADYIIVLGGVGPLRGIRLSLRMIRLRFLLSAGLLLLVTLVGQLSAGMLGENVITGLWRALPLLLVQSVLMGALVFVADVVLVVLYQDAVETGRLEPKRARGVTETTAASPPGRG